MLCRGEKRNIPNACHFSPLSVCLSCLMNNGLLKWCRLWRALGEVEPAYRASFSPVWGQEMSALFWRLFVAPLFLQPRPVWDGLYSGTHSGHYAPAVPFTQLWASVPEPAEFTQKGATLSQGPLHLWERPGLSHVPPPTWPKTGSRLKPAWMYTPLGSSEVGLLGSNFQPPCGISIHNLPTRGRDNDTQWLEVPFPQAEGLITAKLWVSSGGASSLIIRTMKAVGLAWHVARQNSVVRKGSLWPTYQRACMWVIGTRNTGSQVQHGQPGGRGQWTPRQKSRLSSCSHPLCVCRCDSLLALPLSLGSTRAALEAWSFRLSHNTYAVGW